MGQIKFAATLVTLLVNAGGIWAAEVGTAFTYQGVLENPPGQVVNDTCAFEFALCDDAAAACAPGTLSSHPAIEVTYGVVTVPDVDFGAGSITGEARWMEISVKCSGDSIFTTLLPRVELKPAPHALALPGLYTQQNATSPNIIGGFNENLVPPLVVGATISGGGADDDGIGEPENNRVYSDYGSIGGGMGNETLGLGATVSGGRYNSAGHIYAFVGGGLLNSVDGFLSTISGGSENAAAGERAFIGGGDRNEANGNGCVIGGGVGNTADGSYTVIGGGVFNSTAGNHTTIGGGDGNVAGDYFSTVGGGAGNQAVGLSSVISGGYLNVANGWYGVIGGGYSNEASGTSSTICGGTENAASGNYSITPGGFLNEAGGDYSFAAGQRAKVGAADAGTFVWADSTDADFASTGPNQFLIRASGGVGIGTNTPVAQLDVNGATRASTVEITGGSPLVQPLAGWGGNEFGQINVPAGTFTTVAAGYAHSLAIRSDGSLVGWGNNAVGQIDVPFGTYIAVAAGGEFSLAIRNDGTLIAWGNNNFGQRNVPTGTFTAVAAGYGHGLAIRADGTLVGWGYNNYGQIDVPAGVFTAVAAGEFHSLAIRNDGTVAAWGRNDSGQNNVPMGVFTAIAAGAAHSLAINTNGTLSGWGSNANGLSTVPPGAFIAVAAGSDHSLAIRSDGTLVGWGYNNYGQIDVPVGTFAAVSGGHFHSLAIRTMLSAPDPALQLFVDSAFKPGSNTWTIYSDRRLKKNVTPLSGALDHLLQLRGVTFNWMDPASQGGITGTQMGLIADEVQRVFPQWVGRDPKGYQTLTVGGFEALTAEALRELRAEKDRQLSEKDCEIEELKARLARLEAFLNSSTIKKGEGQ